MNNHFNISVTSGTGSLIIHITPKNLNTTEVAITGKVTIQSGGGYSGQ